MKIAQIAPIAESVPPVSYGGTERIVYNLTEELVRRGHEVTLFASGDSVTSAKLVSVVPASLRNSNFKNPYGLNEWWLLNIGLAYQLQNEFDIIHDHNSPVSLPVANLSKTPVVVTMHGAFNSDNSTIFRVLRNPYVVTISLSQASSIYNINKIGTVYNGLEMNHYPFSARSDGYLLYVGRLHPEKGVHHAIDVAKALGLPLVIAARVAGSEEQEYFEISIKPHLNDRIKFVGEVTEDERNKLMSRALAFLHPVTWPEPFGLTMIEAMATGCPVVAFDRGSIPEVVENGQTGYVVSTVGQMVAAVSNIDKIDRQNCRRVALTKFNSKKMADSYEAIYTRILKPTLQTKEYKNRKLPSLALNGKNH